MTNEEIISEIKANLTGDFEKDLPYLRSKIEEYADNEEIRTALAHMAADIMPEEMQLPVLLDMFRDCKESVKEQGPKKAFEELSPIMEAIEEIIDDDTAYINEPFEEVLFEHIYKGHGKALRLPIADVYLSYISLLSANGFEEEAKGALARAKRLCPVNARFALLFAGQLLFDGYLNDFLDTIRETFPICFTPRTLAGCYSELGKYFSDRELYRESLAAYTLSLKYEKHPAFREDTEEAIKEVYENSAEELTEPTPEEIEAIAEKYDFPTGPSVEILGYAKAFGVHFQENEKIPDAARYFLTIVYDLTGDEDAKKRLDSLK